MSFSKEEREAMQALLNSLKYAGEANSGKSYTAEGSTEEQSATDISAFIAESIVKQFETQIEMTKVVPHLLPTINNCLANVAPLLSYYELVRNFIRKEMSDSVMLVFKDALVLTDGNQQNAMELTKMVIEQNNRLSDVIKDSVKEAKKEKSK